MVTETKPDTVVAGKPKVVFDANGAVRMATPAGATVVSCWRCGRTLCYSFGFNGRLEIICKRCKAPCVLTGDASYQDRAESRKLETARRADKLEMMGFKDSITPTAADIIEMMESKYREMGRIRALHSASIAVGLRFDVLKRDCFKCRYCGASVEDGVMLHVDHLIAQSKGGATSLDNLVTACFDCNIGKSNKDL